MTTFDLPYGKSQQTFHLPPSLAVEVIEPPRVAAATDPKGMVDAALDAPVGGVCLSDFRSARSAAVAINDKTRPVPHQHLLPPLLAHLEELGLPPQSVRLIIATGAHAPMPPEEYPRVVPAEILARYPLLCHDTDRQAYA